MCPDPPPPPPRCNQTCDLSLVLLTIFIELNSGFKNIEPPPPQLPDLVNTMRFTYF